MNVTDLVLITFASHCCSSHPKHISHNSNWPDLVEWETQ